MNNRKSLPTMAIILLSSLMSNLASADEGQWQPHQLPQLQTEFDRIGMQLSASQVADLSRYPMNAMVGLGYCSASFVSNQGLVVTNHHCAAGAVQYNSTVDNNLTQNGFLARSQAQEPSAGPQERFYLTESVTDVTAQVTANLHSEMSGKQRYDAIENQRKQLIAECESSPDYRCSVSAFHHGMEYFLLKQLMIKDVRLVYSPPEAIGNFGGDIDNYEYPRHAGDFAFLRAYVDKSGKPAPYSKDNVPYQPKSWLKINASGVKVGDPILVAGYPGRTSRYKLASEVAFVSQWAYPTYVRMNQMTLDIIAENTVDKPQAKVSYSSTVKSINNRMKKYQGLLDGFKATDIHGIKQQKEQALLSWINADPSRAGFAQAHQRLSQLLVQDEQAQQRDFYYDYAQSAKLLQAAMKLYRLAKEAEKPDAERKSGYQERDLAMQTARLKQLQKRFDKNVDQALWSAYLMEYAQSSSRVSIFDQLLGLEQKPTQAQIDALITPFYQQTNLADEDTRLGWIGKPVSAFEASNDPFIRLAVQLYDTNLAFEQQAEELSGQLAQYRPQYMKAIIAYNQSRNLPVYPDANRTLRVTYGTVDGYPAADAVTKGPFTSLRGLLAKDTGKKPFDLPNNVKQAIQNQQYGSYLQPTLEKPTTQSWICGFFDCGQSAPAPFNSVPVNFLSSADTTGGNSGSPVLNGAGELVGLNFDSTYESITKDWYFNAKITRAIHVDIRYLLWMLEVIEQGDNLINEMTIIRDKH